jgi:3-oxoacyl-[acyl-carrier-protein] synthase II
MMATGTDENLPIITEFAQKLGVAANDVVVPYANAEGFVVGDGSVSILLEEEEYAKARSAKVYCYALGFGHGRKNVKFGKLSGSDEALDKAIADALADADITAADVDAVCGFANGYKKIDDIEKGALKRVFGEKLAAMPLFEVKERTGEGRAGSAALAAAEAALLLSGELANDNAYFVAADGSVSAKTAESANLKKILVISYATGGSYSAVVFGK